MRIGIRREDKNEWERRTPLTPENIRQIAAENDVEFIVQPSSIRVFSDDEYAAAGARIEEDLSSCDLVMGVKEMPPEFFRQRGAYLFFSHTIKCQPYNMPMMKALLEKECTLLDYEIITDDQGRRLVFFGRFAGLAGMIDTLHALGQRLRAKGISSPFEAIKMAHDYGSLEKAKEAVAEAGHAVASGGIPAAIAPLVVGFAGYGNVSQGAQEILDLLPVEEVSPSELKSVVQDRIGERSKIFKVVFKEEHMVVPKEPGATFRLQDYYDNPEKYEGVFAQYLPYLSVLMNCIFWTERYPRLFTKDFARQLFEEQKEPKILIVGDISCDIEGSIEMTTKVTTPAEPCFVYDPITGTTTDGYEGRGIVVMAVDNLPCELPRESSEAFGKALSPLVAQLAEANLQAPEPAAAGLAGPLERAVIAWHGRLSERFKYIGDCVKKQS